MTYRDYVGRHPIARDARGRYVVTTGAGEYRTWSLTQAGRMRRGEWIMRYRGNAVTAKQTTN